MAEAFINVRGMYLRRNDLKTPLPQLGLGEAQLGTGTIGRTQCFVAQVSKPAVSPIFQSAGLGLWHDPRV